MSEKKLSHKLHIPAYPMAAGSVINCAVWWLSSLARTCQAGNIRSLMLKQSLRVCLVNPGYSLQFLSAFSASPQT